MIKNGDPVPQWLGIRGGTSWYKANRATHRFVRDDRRDTFTGKPKPGEIPNDYLQLITPDMIWPVGNGQPGASTHYEKRAVYAKNTTPETININFRYLYKSNDQWLWSNWIGNQLPPRVTKPLINDGIVVATKAISLIGHSPSSDWDYQNPPIVIVPDQGYEGAPGVLGKHTLIFQSAESPSSRTWLPSSRMDAPGYDTCIWIDLGMPVAYRYDGPGQTYAYERFDSDSGYLSELLNNNWGPFSGADEIINNCYQYIDIMNIGVHWFIPKSGVGTSYIWDINNSTWSSPGSLAPYVPTSPPPGEDEDTDVESAELSSSRWDSTYDSPTGSVRAIITFAGDTGNYKVLDGGGQPVEVGSLTFVKYFVQHGGQWLISGRWSLHGISGTFQFNGNGSPNQFVGGWMFDPPLEGGGSWNGQRLST